MKLKEINLYWVKSPLTVPHKVAAPALVPAIEMLMGDPMTFEQGDIILPAGDTPEIDRDVLAAHTIASERYGASVAPVGLKR